MRVILLDEKLDIINPSLSPRLYCRDNPNDVIVMFLV